MTTPIKWESEFLVNTSLDQSQRIAEVAALSNGQFLVVFTDASGTGGDTSGEAVKGQIFNADGQKAGAEFLINTTTTDDQYRPQIGALPDGRFVVAYTDESLGVDTGGDDASSQAVRAQLFESDGTKVGAEFLVNDTQDFSQRDPSISVFADGRFMIAYESNSTQDDDDSGFGLSAQLYGADGTPIGSNMLLNKLTPSNQTNVEIVALPDGNFAIVYEDASQNSSDTNGKAVIFEIQSFVDGRPAFGAANTTSADAQFEPDIAVLTNGGFVVVFTDQSATGDDTSGSAVRAQIFLANGDKVGAEILVNTITSGNQASPAVTGLASGGFIVTYSDASANGVDTDGIAIRAQLFDQNGLKIGDEFLVNTVTTGDQSEPSITELPDGRIVFVWTDHSAGAETFDDMSVDAVRGQIFDPRVSAVNLKGSAQNDQFVGTQWNDRLDGKAGKDTLNGGLGDDTYILDNTRDKVIESGGKDLAKSKKINLDLGKSKLDGVENAELTGRKSLNLTGDAGKNILTGNRGENKIAGKKGNDKLEGGKDQDVFVFKTNWDKDTVLDFKAKGRSHDILDLRGLKSVSSFADLMAHHVTSKNGDVIIKGGNGDQVKLKNVKASDLDAGDFLI